MTDPTTPNAAPVTSENTADEPLLDVRDLEVTFQSSTGIVHAVQGINFSVYPGQTVAIVGESGSGKSTSAHAIIDLLPGTGKVTGGQILFDGQDLTKASKRDFVRLRGREIGLVPQDPMSNLNPVWRIGFQVKEVLRANNIEIDTSLETRLVAELVGAGLANARTRAKEALAPVAPGSDVPPIRERVAHLLAEVEPLVDEHEVTTDLTASDVPEVSAERLAVAQVKADALIAAGPVRKRQAANYMAAELLTEAGLPDALHRSKQYPHEFSGGMRQRALIAIGLGARPKLLIADEPTSALDVTVQRQILDHLGWLTRELGTAVLFITHDLGLAAERAEHLIVMYQGKVVESGPALEILQNPAHPYTKRLVAAAPSLASRRIQSAKAAGIKPTELLATTGGDGVSASRDDVLRVENLTKVFQLRGGRPGAAKSFKAVDDVSFTVKRGTTTAIVGESGSGKSTVANIVLNLLEPTEGKIFHEGLDTSTLNASQRFNFRSRVQPIFQDPYGSLDPMYSIYRTIEEPLRIHKSGNKAARVARVKELLDMVRLPQSTMGRYPNELSGGQRQRIAIARALALSPEIIVCDEAVSALDVLVQEQILTLLNDLQAELRLTYLFITHDLAVVRQIADEVCVMESGRIVEAATTDEVFDNPQQEYTRKLLSAIPGSSLELASGS